MTTPRKTAPCLPLITLFMALSAAADTTVSGLALTATPDDARFSFTLSRETTLDTFTLTDPPRFVIDLDDASLDAGAAIPPPVAEGPVRAIRHGRQPDGRLRLVLDLVQSAVVERLAATAPAADDFTLSFRIAVTDPPPASPVDADAGTTAEARIEVAGDSDPAVGAAGERAEAEAGTTFVFGSAASRAGSAGISGQTRQSTPRDDWQLRLQRGLVETGLLYDDDRPADGVANLQFIASATRALRNGIEIRLGARVDGQYETGGNDTLQHLEVEYDETWLRYRAKDWRLTLGTQKVTWGRSDEIAPTDRLSTQDFTRLLLDQRADRRRANPAIRLEWFGDNWNADLVWLPLFREGELPQRDSIWYPVDREPGIILGLPDAPLLSTLVGNATFDEGASGDGGGGIRLNRFGRGVDYAVSLQRVRNSQPYFRLDESQRRALLGGMGPTPGAMADPLSFEAVYPRSWVIGGDAGFALDAWTIRLEAAWSSDMPVTRENLAFDTVPAWHWLVGAETFPGDGDLRLTVQLAGMQMQDSADVLDQNSTLTLLGEVAAPFAGNRWRANLRYWVGIEQKETYLNPELVWTVLEPHEFYLGMHLFDGESRTIGGFYDPRDMIVFGWRGRF